MAFRVLKPAMDGVVYKPCKNCGSTEYDQSEQKVWDSTPDGKEIVEPDSCDVCNFE